MTPKLILDLFAGPLPGGWDVAARSLGMERVAGIEWDEAACMTRAAAGHSTVRADITAFPVERLGGKVTGLVASPVCVSFSAAGKRGGNVVTDTLGELIRDLFAGRPTRAARRREMAAKLMAAGWASPKLPRADRSAAVWKAVRSAALVAEPARFIAACRPEWVALEQVPPVLPLWEVYADELRKLGYSAWCGKLNAADYSVPQTRIRAILIASRVREVRRPWPTHYDPRRGEQMFGEPWVSMAQALGHGASVRPSPSVTAGGTSTGGAEPFPARARAFLATERAARRWVSMGDALGLTNDDDRMRGSAAKGSPERQRLLAHDTSGAPGICAPLGVDAGERPDSARTRGGSSLSGPLVLQSGPYGTGDKQGEHPARHGNVSDPCPEDGVPEGSPLLAQGRREAVLPDLPARTATSERPESGTEIHRGPGHLPARSSLHAGEHGVLSAGAGRQVAGEALPDLPASQNASLQGAHESAAHLADQWVLVSGNQPNAAERPAPAPAPTIAFGHNAGNVRWKLRNGSNDHACERDADEPAGTLFFGGRANWAAWVAERPAMSVMGDPRLGRPGHKGRERGGESHFAKDSVRITVGEAAILQSFPPGYPWRGSRTKQYEQCGNAFPPLAAIAVLGEAVGVDWVPAAARYRDGMTVRGSGEAE